MDRKGDSMMQRKRLRGWILAIFCLALLLNGFTSAADNDNEDLSKKIEEEGKSIDKVSSMIEHSTENMEDEIEEAGKNIDSPDAEKRIMVAGKEVDDLAEKMDKETEAKGDAIEKFMQPSEKESEDQDIKGIEKGDKHGQIRDATENELTPKRRTFEMQEKLRQKLEDLVETQGQKVEAIGNEMEKSRRDFIQKGVRKGRHSKGQQRRLKSQRSKGWLRGQGKKRKLRKHVLKYVNKNATKRRVIIPVNRGKLEKLMLYYYINDKMNKGELNSHNLAKFFDHVETLPLENKEKSQKMDQNSQKLSFTIDEKEEKNDERKLEKDILDVKDIFGKFLASKKKEEEKINSDDRSEKGSIMKYLESNGNARESTPTSSADDDKLDVEHLQQAIAQNENSDANVNIFTTDQVHKMLDKIKMINSTIYQMEKKKNKEKEKLAKKKCTDSNCVGRTLISLLDDALHAVKQEKTEKPVVDARPAPHKAMREMGATRSKSDPYEGIGFAETQEKTAEADGDSTGLERQLSSHGVDVLGTSHPVGIMSERAHLRYNHQHDDEDDGDDDDDDEDDGYGGYHHGHGSHFPMMPHQMHHVHHHVHHLVHDDDSHHGDDHHGYHGGFRGFHGHSMPIRTNYHHDDHGYVEPLNVDTAPMPHYPNRHVNDHVDVDTLLRGHPFNYHRHTPEVALEGPISTSSVYEDMHHMLNGPGIHDQPDVHYEVEMHAHPIHHETREDDEDGDHGEHDDDDYHDDDHHEGHHGYNTHGDKKHIIQKMKKKKQFRRKPVKSIKHKHGLQKMENKKRQRRHEDEEDEDDDDVRVEKVPRNGHGVARLSYLTQRNGEDMEHEINEGILDVEDVGRSIEEKVQRGVDRVTEISNHDVEAPDYDSEGHMEHTIHREDIEESREDD